MYKYWLLFKTHWQNTLAYPVSFWMWRFRQVLATFASITVWLAIFKSQSVAFGYTQDAMVSYIFLIGFLQSIIVATQTGGLGQQIYEGQISNVMVKPLSVLGWIGAIDLADKAYNFTFLIFETILLYFIFKPHFVIPSPQLLAAFLITTIMGAILLFLAMLLIGVIGFWSPDNWGIRFLFYMFIDFTAGRLYPLNILPKTVQSILSWTPFPYFSYFQSQIFLGKMSWPQIQHSFLILSIWILFLGVTFRYFWLKGLKSYGAMGH